jgi:hypothetical protein
LDQKSSRTSKAKMTTDSPAEVTEAPEADTPGWRPRRASVEWGSMEGLTSAPDGRRIC